MLLFKIITLVKAVLKVHFLAGNFNLVIADLCIIDILSFLTFLHYSYNSENITGLDTSLEDPGDCQTT